ncbi:MAG TPA: CBS domain-containing protein [Thermodesulfobacteriota bacterium]|nr:CBS domain-containing protein [Thermodesulfobacteriota bacterium]
MIVKEWMTPNPVTVHPDTGVKTAFRLIKKGGFKQLPVVEDGKLIGIITDRDIRRPEIIDELESWEQLYRLDDAFKVRGIMTKNVLTVHENESLESACLMLRKKKFNALPVLSDEGELVGILTVHDVLDAFIDSLKLKEKMSGESGSKD